MAVELVEPQPPVSVTSPVASPSVPAGWENILNAGETILWQGQPDPSLVFSPAPSRPVFGGLVTLCFSIYWMYGASRAGGIFWMFGLIFFFVSIFAVLDGIFGGAWRRRHCFYTLTSTRAIIASDYPMLGRRLKSYPITSASVLELQEDGAWSTVNFHEEKWRDSDGDRHKTIVGFQRIRDGRHVFSLMRQIQSEAK